MKINNFRGDLSDISAKKKALVWYLNQAQAPARQRSNTLVRHRLQLVRIRRHDVRMREIVRYRRLDGCELHGRVHCGNALEDRHLDRDTQTPPGASIHRPVAALADDVVDLQVLSFQVVFHDLDGDAQDDGGVDVDTGGR